jgi:KaiC/GvpD/RAD55 family RecA-like ATPase
MSRANAAILIDIVKQTGMTSLGLAQKVEGMPGETVDIVSEFKGDGLITLKSVAVGKTLNRTLEIKKLRKTKIDGIPHAFEFTKEGIVLK